MKRNNLITGALILSIGAIMAKIFSSIYRIMLTRILGAEGIGLYQLIFPFYSLCVVLATAGLPMAISKVIAKHKGSENKIVKKCLSFTSIVSLALTFILIVSSGGLASIQGAREISICYIILAPTILIVSASSVFRGYFQGRQYFTPSALSNILEQFFKLVLGLALTLILSKFSVISAIIGAVISIDISELISIFVLLLFYKKREKIIDNTEKVPLKQILKDVLPITLTNVIMPIANFIDSLIVVNLLAVNFSKSVSIFLYGLESGAVSSIITLPTIFSFAIASVLLPNLTSGGESNRSRQLGLAIKIILIITVPCVIGFSLFPDRLISLLYGSRLNGYNLNGLKIASKIMAFSGIGVIFLSINQLYSSCLQAVELRYTAVKNLTIAVAIKFVFEIIFLPYKNLNIYALALANSACYLLVFVLNHLEIKNHFELRFNFTFTAKLILCNALMLLTMLCVFMANNSGINTLVALGLGGGVYLCSIFIFNLLNKQDSAKLKFKMKNKTQN